jgi:hypothetical protein
MRLRSLKLLKRLKLNQSGVTHYVVPVIVILLVAGVGTYVVSKSLAATNHTGIEMANSDLCVRYSSAHDTLTLQPCSASDSGQYWSIGSRIENDTSSGENDCIIPRSGSGAVTVSVQLCVGSAVESWARPPAAWGAGANTVYNVSEYAGGKGPKRCLVDPAGEYGESGGSLETTGCDNSKENYADQNFHDITLPANSTPTPVKSPAPTPTPPKPVTTGNCTGSDFYSGTSGSCVSAIQGILNATYAYYRTLSRGAYKGSNIAVDGEYGAATEGQVKIFQGYFLGSSNVDGVVGPKTWESLCSVAYPHDSTDYKKAGCKTT